MLDIFDEANEFEAWWQYQVIWIRLFPEEAMADGFMNSWSE